MRSPCDAAARINSAHLIWIPFSAADDTNGDWFSTSLRPRKSILGFVLLPYGFLIDVKKLSPMPSGCIEFGEYLDTEVICSALRTNYAPLIAPLRHVDVDLHLRQIRSPTHSLSKVARHTRHRRVLSVVASVSRFLCVSCMGSLSALRLLPKDKAETARIIGLGTELDMGMTEAHCNPQERVPAHQKVHCFSSLERETGLIR